MKKKLTPTIAVTMGDPGGIGPEIILKALGSKDTYNYCNPLVIGSASVISYYKDKLKYKIKINNVKNKKNAAFNHKTINILDIGSPKAKIKEKVPSKDGGRLLAKSIIKGVELALEKKVDAITTAPISKVSLNLAGHKYPGHTEMLASLTNTKDYAMMLTGKGLRVILATTHMGVKEVNRALSIPKILKFIDIINDNMHYFGKKNPKIAVTALNPHAGEDGLFGIEEIKIIAPAIKEARENGILTYGPFPADTLFVANMRKKFDAVLVMYHDQGLIPLKMLAFGRSVNVTLGLPIIRTSVDHGTAFDITGKGVADEGSLIEALKLAAKMAKKNQITSPEG